MQIHELTRKQPVKEGMLGSLAAGIAKQVGKQAMDKIVPGAGAVSQTPQDRIGAFNATMPLVKTLTATLQKTWTQTIANYLANSKAGASGFAPTAVAELTPDSQAGLEQELRRLVNQSINPRGSSFDYMQLPQTAGTDPVAKQGAEEVKRAIDTWLGAIWQGTVKGTKQADMTALWTKLAAEGIAPGQNILAYDRPQTSTGIRWGENAKGEITINLGQGWEKFDRSNPKHADAAAKQSKGLGK